MSRSGLLFLPLLLLTVSSCGEFRESMREKYTGERRGTPVVGGRRAPVLNPAPMMATPAPVQPVNMKPIAPIVPSAPAAKAASSEADPYDMYDNKGNVKEAPKETPKAAPKEEPKKPEQQSNNSSNEESWFSRWFGGKKEEKVVADTGNGRKSFKGNNEVNVADVPPAIVPTAPAKEPAKAAGKMVAKKEKVPALAAKEEPQIAKTAPKEAEPVLSKAEPAVTVPEAPAPVADNSVPIEIPTAAEQPREDMGNGVIIPLPPRSATKEAPVPAPTPAAPVTAPDIRAESPKAAQVAMAATSPSDAPKLSDVPQKPEEFKAIKATKDQDQKDLQDSHDKALDEKKTLDQEPTDLPKQVGPQTSLPKIEDTIEEIRGALESPVPIITASAR